MSKQQYQDDQMAKLMAEESSGSYFEPNSVLDGCIQGIKDSFSDPALMTTNALVTGAAGAGAVISGANPIGAIATALGGEMIGACVYGAANTAIDNYNITSNPIIESNTTSTDLYLLGKTDHINLKDTFHDSFK